MRSRTIEVNGVEVRLFENGEFERLHLRRDRLVRGFGTKTGNGYMIASIGGRRKPVHRMIAEAFLHNFSESLQVDHINGDKSDNRAENLRMATCSENQRAFKSVSGNARSEYRGVYWYRDLWRACITVNGKNRHLGSFFMENDAAEAYNAAATEEGFLPEAMNTINNLPSRRWSVVA